MATADKTPVLHVPVLIVGGGPVGLTASLLLSHFGIESMLVNHRSTTSTHPRARFIDVRTVEILHQIGLADDVIATGLPPEWVQSVRYSETFTSPEVYRLPTDSYHSVPRDYSPTIPVMTAQDLVEPIMFAAARSCDTAQVRFGHELVALVQDADSCTARIRDLESGAEFTVASDYVIGADGRHSTVRELLGGELEEGFSRAMPVQDVLYHADMSRWVGDRIGALLFVHHPRGYGLFQPMDGKTRWRAQCTTFNPPIDADAITEADCVAWIRSAIGDTDGELELTVEGIAPWAPEARLSDRFRQGRVFLAGDAAHMLMPTGGYGMNLGYHGIHNLAWKIAFVLNGWATRDILDTYEQERRPQSDLTRVASVDNARLAGNLYRTHYGGGDLADAAHRLRQYGNFEGMILGFEYASPLCLPDAEPGPQVENQIVDFEPCVRAGRRAPHVWLDERRTRSVLHEFGRDYVLLIDPVGQPAIAAEVDRLATGGLPLRIYPLPDPVYDAGLYRRGENVLVRPDGVVAGRFSATAPIDLPGLLQDA